jgi:hypothetical protein
VLLPQEDLEATPTLAFGDGNSGFFESADNVIEVSIAGSPKVKFNTGQVESTIGTGWLLPFEAASATNPTLCPAKDFDTGIGRAANDQLSLIAGGIEALRITEASSINTFDFDAGDNGAEQVGALTSLKSVSASVPGAAAATITATNLIPAGPEG